MAFVTLLDKTGRIELIVFPRVLEQFDAVLLVDNIVKVDGKVSAREDEEPKLLVDSVEIMDDSNECVTLDIDDPKVLNDLNPIVRAHIGNIPLQVNIAGTVKKAQLKVDGSETFLTACASFCRGVRICSQA